MMEADRRQLRMLESALNGDAEAFVSLCNRYAEALYRYLYFRLGSVFAAEEMCGQLFVRAWETLPTDPRQGAVPFTIWLFQVANDVIRERSDQLSSLGLHPPRPPLVAWSVDSESKQQVNLHPRYLAQAVMQLDDIAQQVILLRFVLRLPHRDVALAIDETRAGSRVLQYRALLELRERLTRQKMSEFAYATDYVSTATFCIDRIISGQWDVKECLQNVPEETERLSPILDFAMLVRETCTIRPRRDFNADLRRQLLNDIRESKRRPRHKPKVIRWLQSVSDRIPQPVVAAFVLGLLLLAVGIGITGALFVIDGAAPGDRLYALDLQLERTYRALPSSPERKLQFALQLTDERLAEAEKLARRGDSSGLQVAMVAYSVEVASLADYYAGAFNGRSSEIDSHFARQQQRLDKLLVTALGASPMGRVNGPPVIDCEDPQRQTEDELLWHPVGLTLAAQHHVEYGDVIEWVCAGHSFGEIVLALATVDSGQFHTDEVLLRKAQLGGWGQLWQEMAIAPNAIK